MPSFMKRVLLAVLIALAISAPRPSTAAPAHRGLIITDLHFDPFYNEQPNTTADLLGTSGNWDTIFDRDFKPAGVDNLDGKDADYGLIRDAVDNAKSMGPYEVVICTGDMLPHGFSDSFDDQSGVTPSEYPTFAKELDLYLVDKLQSTFHADVIYALGNNDSDTGDYKVPSPSFLAALAAKLTILKGNAAAQSTFLDGGYYFVPFPGLKSRDVAVLNSVLWIPGVSATDGDAEMKWLEDTVDHEPAGRKITLVMHVPPGGDYHGNPFWDPCYAKRFCDLVKAHKDQVDLAFAAHTHMDEFRLLEDGSGDPVLPVHIAPSVGPNHNNNPAFQIVDYDDDGAVQDIDTEFTDRKNYGPFKHEYRFSDYKCGSFDAAGLKKLDTLLNTSAPEAKVFGRHYTVSNGTHTMPNLATLTVDIDSITCP